MTNLSVVMMRNPSSKVQSMTNLSVVIMRNPSSKVQSYKSTSTTICLKKLFPSLIS